MKGRVLGTCLAALLVFFVGLPAYGGSYATDVIHYVAGTGVTGGYTDPTTALGAPEQFTGEGVYPGMVTMFNGPFGTDEIVSIGAGGSLVLGFDHQVMNDPNNPFGFDFIVFGNASFWDLDWPNGIAGPVYAEPGQIRVSQDNNTWYDIVDITADNLFPTQGFTDTSGPYSYSADFTKPVNPALADNYEGMSYAELLAAYDDSGGGTGVDLALAVDSNGSSVDLGWIQYVEIWQPGTDGWTTEIDAISDVAAVPLPGAVWLLGSGLLAILGLSRKRQ